MDNKDTNIKEGESLLINTETPADMIERLSDALRESNRRVFQLENTFDSYLQETGFKIRYDHNYRRYNFEWIGKRKAGE